MILLSIMLIMRQVLLLYILWGFVVLNQSNGTSTRVTSILEKQGSKRVGLSIDLNKPAPEELDVEHTSKKGSANRKRVVGKYIDKINADPTRKAAHLERRRKRERIWRANRYSDMTEEQKQAHIAKTQKRKNAAYIKRKPRFGGMSSGKHFKRHQIINLQKDGKEIPKEDLAFLQSLRNADRLRAQKLRSSKSTKSVQDAPSSKKEQESQSG